MEEKIIGMIAEAEREASERKARAQVRAAEIVAEAEHRALEIAKKSDAACKSYRETALKEAAESAQKEYDKSIAACRTEAEKYANGLLEGANAYVTQIVGRLTK